MSWEMEPGLHWTEHYVRYGYAVRKKLVDTDFCEKALGRVRELLDTDLPLAEWTTENTKLLHRPFYEGATPPELIFDSLLEQSRLRAAIEELYGGAGQWNEERNYYMFVRPYQPDAEQKLSPTGHIDFTAQPIPALYRGFTFQVALHDTEPFSGNITIYPGTHKIVQKMVMDDSEGFKARDCELPFEKPFEFVAEAGDVIFIHHLVLHSGNNSHADNHTPRAVLHAEAFRDAWLPEIDPSAPGLSPWQRSLAFNGAYASPPEVERAQMQHREEYIEKLRREGVDAMGAY